MPAPDPHDGSRSPIGFKRYGDFDRVRKGTQIAHRSNLDSRMHAPVEMNHALPVEALVRVTGEYNSTLEAYPAVFTYKNIHRETMGEPLWIDGDPCVIFDLNDLTLRVGRRYKANLYDSKIVDDKLVIYTTTQGAATKTSSVVDNTSCTRWLSIIKSGKCAKATMIYKAGACNCLTLTFDLMVYDSGLTALVSQTAFVTACELEDEEDPPEVFSLVMDVVETTTGYMIRGRLRPPSSGLADILLTVIDCDKDSSGNYYINFHTRDERICKGDPALVCAEDGLIIQVVCQTCAGVVGACTACSLVGNSPTMVIPDGPNAGTYPATAGWNDPGLYYEADFVGFAVRCAYASYGEAGYGDIVANDLYCIIAPEESDTGNQEFQPASAVTCGTPTTMTFPGTHFQSVGDVVITT